MDAFYASVEQLDNPELKGKPVIVGGSPHSRGVVAACSYEARKFGIHSAMPCAQAYKRCRHAVFIPPRMYRYKELSSSIMAIFKRYTDVIEPLSLDEAFLDITTNKIGQTSATLLAEQICQQIVNETGLTASAGVSCNKFVAKIASDLNKPNGISVIEPHQVPDFLAQLPIGKFFGVGRVTEKKMKALGIKTGSDLLVWSLADLIEKFGKSGKFYYDIVRGNDPRPVRASRTRKSIGAERTLQEDSVDINEIHGILSALAIRIGDSLTDKYSGCRSLTLKVRYADFSTITRSLTPKYLIRTAKDIKQLVPQLLRSTDAGSRAVRLVGLSATNLVTDDRNIPRQLELPFNR